MKLAPHLAGLGTTIFAEMSALAVATGSINLGQGFPDVDGPDSIARAAADAVISGKGNQYPPGPGIPELRQAVAAHQSGLYDLAVDPDREVLITAGATEAIAAAMFAFVDIGDEVVALEPFYDSYRATVTMARGRCVPVRLDSPDFRLDEARLRAAVSPKTKLILLNSPHNPTGAVLSMAELEAVAKIAIEHDLLVVSDEVYEHLAFDEPHIPIATLPGMRERTVSISSSGKTFSFTGWKVGWATGPQDLIDAVRTTKQFLTFVSAGPFQYAITHALNVEMPWVDSLRDSLEARRDLLSSGLNDLGMTTFRPRGTYFVTSDVAPLGWSDAYEFCRELPRRARVVAVPCSTFYDDPTGPPASHVRWTFTKQESVLTQALDQMASSDLRQHASP
ncbi:MAG TPA: pyridoxal phosphate-dependent aminotransferase [Actinomycetes bacterium]|nr:pyridoxal phosphate-dependent aminotransferase [Actinomycetes bacterium]